MRKFIISIVIIVGLIGGLIYFVFTSSKSLSITYIKFNINPSFIIGVNDKDVVKVYNPLNEDAKIFNLEMFRDKSMEDVMSIVLNTLSSGNYLDGKEIYITVISKNISKINYYYDKFNFVIKNQGKDLSLINKDASDDELLTYSNEIAYDVKASYKNSDLLKISENIRDILKEYTDNKISSLNLDKYDKTGRRDVLNERYSSGYFNDFTLSYYDLGKDNLKVLEGSNYNITFSFDELMNVSYNIALHLTIQYAYDIMDKDVKKGIIEVYQFDYDNNISNMTQKFYKFSY